MDVWFGYIYKTVNLLNGKIYIGQRKGDFDRSYHGSGIHIVRAIKLHGKNFFKTDVLSYCSTRQELDEMERHHIRVHRNSLPSEMIYNIDAGGRGRSGNILTEEHKRKIGLGGLGRKRTEETRKNISSSLMGHSVTEEARAKMSLAKKGKRKTSEHIENMRIAKSGKPLSQKNREGISKALMGHSVSSETREKISNTKRRKTSNIGGH